MKVITKNCLTFEFSHFFLTQHYPQLSNLKLSLTETKVNEVLDR